MGKQTPTTELQAVVAQLRKVITDGWSDYTELTAALHDMERAVRWAERPASAPVREPEPTPMTGAEFLAEVRANAHVFADWDPAAHVAEMREPEPADLVGLTVPEAATRMPRAEVERLVERGTLVLDDEMRLRLPVLDMATAVKRACETGEPQRVASGVVSVGGETTSQASTDAVRTADRTTAPTPSLPGSGVDGQGLDARGVGAAGEPSCRRCHQCVGFSHHWMEDFDGGEWKYSPEPRPVWACKHCDIVMPHNDTGEPEHQYRAMVTGESAAPVEPEGEDRSGLRILGGRAASEADKYEVEHALWSVWMHQRGELAKAVEEDGALAQYRAIAIAHLGGGATSSRRATTERLERERDDAKEDARAWSASAIKMERERDEAHRLLGRATAYLKSYGIGGKPTEGARTLLIAIEATLKGQNT